MKQWVYDYLKNETSPLIVGYINKESKKLDEAKLFLFSRPLRRIRFYLKLQKFGDKLFLKPVKTYFREDRAAQRKASCDIEMTFYLMNYRPASWPVSLRKALSPASSVWQAERFLESA